MAKLPAFEDTVDLPAFEDTEELPAFEEAVDLDRTSELESFGRGAVQGVTFGLADEAVGLVESALTDKTYEQARDESRKNFKRAEESNPGVSLAGNVAGSIGSAFLPGIGAIGNVAKGASLGKTALAGATQGALTGFGESEEDSIAGIAKDVAIGGAFGGAAGAAIHKAAPLLKTGIGKTFSKLSPGPEGTKKATYELMENAARAYDAQRPLDVKDASRLFKGDIEGMDEQKIKEFAYTLEHPGTTNPEAVGMGFDQAVDTIRSFAQRLDEKEFVKKFENMGELRAAKKANEHVLRQEEGFAANLRHMATNRFIDGMQVARDMDNRLGTNLSETFLDATENINHYQSDLARWLTVKKDIPQDLSDDAERQIWEALDKGKIGELPKELQPIATQWKSFYNDVADYARKIGAPIQKRTDYVPHKMVSMPEAIVKIRQKVKDEGLDSPDVRQAVQYFTGEKLEGEALAKAVDEMMKPGSESFVRERMASALFQREGLLPEFLMEKNLRKLSNSYLQDTLRYGHMKGTLEEIRHQRNVLSAAGAKDDVEWIDRLMTDYLGGARGLAKMTRNGMSSLQVRMLEAAAEAPKGSAKEKVYRFAADTPDAFQNMVLNVYPNFLGWSPRAVTQNLLGGFYTMMPELGLTYGATRGLNAYKNAMRSLATDRAGYFKRLEEAGFVAPQWSTALKETLKTGQPTKGTLGKVSRGADAVAEFGMKAFEASEKINRAVAWETGKLLTVDLLGDALTREAKAARRFLTTMPPALEKRANALVDAKDAEGLERLISKYFADRTLFSYNRLTQSDLSRAAGPLFSMFSKFPAAVSGQIVNDIREKGVKGGSVDITKRLLAPYVAGSVLNLALQEGLEQSVGEDNATAAMQTAFGKDKGAFLGAGLASASPVGAVQSIVEGRIFTPPLIGTAKEAANILANPDEEMGDRALRWLKNTGTAFAPGSAGGITRITKEAAELMGLIEED